MKSIKAAVAKAFGQPYRTGDYVFEQLRRREIEGRIAMRITGDFR